MSQHLRLHELRPHLGNLNWQLRRIGVTLRIVTDPANDEVLGAHVEWAPPSSFVVNCDACGFAYPAGRAARVLCPQCGHEEKGTEREPTPQDVPQSTAASDAVPAP